MQCATTYTKIGCDVQQLPQKLENYNKDFNRQILPGEFNTTCLNKYL